MRSCGGIHTFVSVLVLSLFGLDALNLGSSVKKGPALQVCSDSLKSDQSLQLQLHHSRLNNSIFISGLVSLFFPCSHCE